MAKTEIDNERYNITIRRNSDNALLIAEKVSFNWLLGFLRRQGYKDVTNIKEGNEILGKKSFGKNRTSIQNKIQQNK